MGLAVLYEHAGKPAGAKAAYRKILKLDNQFAPAANNLAWLIAQEDNPDLELALRLAQIAKFNQPESPDILDTLGYIFYKRSAYSQATAQFREAISISPHLPTLHYHLALSLQAQGEDKEALQELEISLQYKGPFPNRSMAEKLLQTWQNIIIQ